MKRIRVAIILSCFALIIIQPVCSFAQKSVLYYKQKVNLQIPDSLDLSQNNYLSLVKQSKIAQFNKLIGVYLNFAMDSLKKGKIELAEQIMMQDAIPMVSRYGDGYNMFHSFMTLGKSYHQQKKYTQAKWFFIQSNLIAQKIGYKSGELFSLIELAGVKVSVQDNKLALQDYKTAATLASKIKFTNTLSSIRKSIDKLNAQAKSEDATTEDRLTVLPVSKN